MLEQLRVKVLKGIFKRVGLGAGNGALDDIGLNIRGGKLCKQEVNRVSETSRIVAREAPDESSSGSTVFSNLIRVLVNGDLYLILTLQLGDKIMRELGRLQKLDQLRAASKHQLVSIWDHAKKLVNAVRHLPLWTSDSDFVARLLSARKVDLAVVLLFKLVDFRKTSNQFTMVQPINTNNLRSILGILLYVLC